MILLLVLIPGKNMYMMELFFCFVASLDDVLFFNFDSFAKTGEMKF